MVKKNTAFIILSLIVFISVIVLYAPPIQQTAFNVGKANINTEIDSTFITKILEDDEKVIYRYTWIGSKTSNITLTVNDNVRIKFDIGDKEILENKIILSNDIENQFEIKTTEVVFTNIEPYSIKRQKAVCSLIEVKDLFNMRKPIISCSINAILYSSENIEEIIISIDGYVDITFLKVEEVK